MNKFKYTAMAVKWWDKVNGNTYHSVRITRHRDGKILCCPFTYGNGHYCKRTALSAMADAGWLPVKYRDQTSYWQYEPDNSYPILWLISEGRKRECVANGKE